MSGVSPNPGSDGAAGKCFNLVPASRLQSRAVRRALSRWAVLIAGCALLFLTPGAFRLVFRGDDAHGLQARIERSSMMLEDAQNQNPVLARQLAELRVQDAVFGRLESRVDWRPLFAAVAEIGGETRFDRIELKIDPGRDGAVLLDVAGYAETLSGAREMVLRFEQSGGFSRVSLESSARVSMPSFEGVRFEIRAVVAGEGGS